MSKLSSRHEEEKEEEWAEDCDCEANTLPSTEEPPAIPSTNPLPPPGPGPLTVLTPRTVPTIPFDVVRQINTLPSTRQLPLVKEGSKQLWCSLFVFSVIGVCHLVGWGLLLVGAAGPPPPSLLLTPAPAPTTTFLLRQEGKALDPANIWSRGLALYMASLAVSTIWLGRFVLKAQNQRRHGHTGWRES